MRGYSQILQEKKRRHALMSGPYNYKYLLELVSLCVRHLKLTDKPKASPGPWQLDAGYPGSSRAGPILVLAATQEADIFAPEAKFLKRVFAEARKTRSIRAMALAHCHYALNDPDQLTELFKTFEIGLFEYDYDRIRPFLCLFETLLETEHEACTSKRAAWLSSFLETVSAGSCYYKWMETVFEFIFKIVSRHEFVREWFYSN